MRDILLKQSILKDNQKRSNMNEVIREKLINYYMEYYLDSPYVAQKINFKKFNERLNYYTKIVENMSQKEVLNELENYID